MHSLSYVSPDRISGVPTIAAPTIPNTVDFDDRLLALESQLCSSALQSFTSAWRLKQATKSFHTVLSQNKNCSACAEEAYTDLILFFEECLTDIRNRLTSLVSSNPTRDHLCGLPFPVSSPVGSVSPAGGGSTPSSCLPSNQFLSNDLNQTVTLLMQQLGMPPPPSPNFPTNFKNEETLNKDFDLRTAVMPYEASQPAPSMPPPISATMLNHSTQPLINDTSRESSKSSELSKSTAAENNHITPPKQQQQQHTNYPMVGGQFDDQFSTNVFAPPMWAPHPILGPTRAPVVPDPMWEEWLGSNNPMAMHLKMSSPRRTSAPQVPPPNLKNRSDLPHLATFLKSDGGIPNFQPTQQYRDNQRDNNNPWNKLGSNANWTQTSQWQGSGFVDFADNENSTNFTSQLPHISTMDLVNILRRYNNGDISRLEAKMKLHDVGSCKPCAFFHFPKKLCNSIKTCHFCHHEEHRRYSMKCWKRRRQRITKDISAADLETVNSLTNDTTLIRLESPEFYREADFIMACRSLKLSVEGSFPASIKPLHQYYLKADVIEMVEQGKKNVESITPDAMLSEEEIAELLRHRVDDKPKAVSPVTTASS